MANRESYQCPDCGMGVEYGEAHICSYEDRLDWVGPIPRPDPTPTRFDSDGLPNHFEKIVDGEQAATTQHSPAPWSACNNGGCRCGTIWSIPDDSIIATVHDDYAEETISFHNGKEKRAANARLIAAAPDLLAACYEAYETLDNEGAAKGPTGEMILKAIAKAKGETLPT